MSSSLWITEKNRKNYDIGAIRNQLVLGNRILTNSMIESATLSRVFDIDVKKFSHVYNGADDIFFESECDDSFLVKYSVDFNYILNVANIERRKNQKLLIESIKEYPEYKLVIIGHVRDHAYYKECGIDENDQVLYVGPIAPSSKLLVSAFKNADCFVLPSELETPGIAAIEAAACGLPLIVTSEGSCEEYFGERANYVAPQDSTDLTRLLGEVLNSKRKNERLNTKFRWRVFHKN